MANDEQDGGSSRRKRALPKNLNENEENENVVNLIDDFIPSNEIKAENSVPEKRAKTSSVDRFSFDWTGSQKRLKNTDFGLMRNFLFLSNSTANNESNDPNSLILLGNFKLEFVPENRFTVLELTNLEKLYLYRTKDEVFSKKYSSNWVLFLDDPNKEETGVLCRVNLTEIEYYSLKTLNAKIYCEISEDFLNCKVYLKEKGIGKHHSANKILIKRFLGLNFYNSSKERPKVRENIDEFYKKLKLNKNLTTHIGIEPQNEKLIPILRPYQRWAVEWMIDREKFVDDNSSKISLFSELNFNGRILFYNPYDGNLLTESPPTFANHIRGGILADEMGLGKTVEILALILLNPKNSCIRSTGQSSITGGGNNSPDALVEVKEILNELISAVSNNIDTDKTFREKFAIASNIKGRRNLPPPIKEKWKKSCDLPSFSSRFSSEPTGPLSCFCGRKDFEEDCSPRIQCRLCGTVQHRLCVHWTYTNVDGDYLCPHCRPSVEPLESKTTLIISPASICHQWYEEIKKHVRSDALKVYVYQGVQMEGFIQPKFLADFDIVITTYETLRSEVNYLDNSQRGRLRHPKRYPYPPTPLTAVGWWRICLDEAQMVEGMNKAATVCARLHSVNRWCVTGTPVQKSVDDLYGLLAFLKVEPYNNKHYWTTALMLPYLNGESNNLVDVVAPILWRTVKGNVLDQLNIPEQKEKLYLLEFGPVEEHFYRRTREACARDVNDILRQLPDLKLQLRDVDKSTLHQILRPLLKLRLACCHLKLIRGGFVNFVNLVNILPKSEKEQKKKKLFTLEIVLTKMIEKTKQECEDEHRSIVAALNGTAGLQQLKEQWEIAAETYRKVLQLCDSYDEKIRTDPLPKIHAFYNLFDLITLHGNQIPLTCKDDALRSDCDQLITKHLSKTLTLLENFKTQLNDTSCSIEEQLNLLKNGGEFWWLEICANVKNSELEWELLEKVRNVLLSANVSFGTNSGTKYHDLNGLQMVLMNLYDGLMQCRKTLQYSLQKLSSRNLDDSVLIDEASLCHLRPVNKINLSSCPICIVDRRFDDYESKLFNFKPLSAEHNASSVMPTEDEDVNVHMLGELRHGTWADSPLEQTLKAIFQFISRQDVAVGLCVRDNGHNHLKLFDMMKKEFRSSRGVWRTIRDHIAQRDEVAIAVERFRFRDVGDPVEASAGPSRAIDRNQIEIVELKLSSDRVTAEKELQKKLGQLNYLTNLSSMRIDDETGNPEECLVCRNSLGFRWSLLTCAHMYCCNCMQHMSRDRIIKCPFCRCMTNRDDVAYVTTRQLCETENDVKIKGAHSTKVECIVKRLMEIQRQDSNTSKCLVFSNWKEVLDLIGFALKQNCMKFVKITGSRNSQDVHEKLSTFKESTDCNILLLPISSGANGLNLIEATHVFFADPPLNPAAEQQALGRVHRMGQKKTTIVHRFLIKGTVEEKIHNILGDTKSDRLLNDNESPLTIGDLVNLFQT